MFRTAVLNPAVVRLTALAVVLTLAAHKAEAQVKPFKVTGGGPAPDGLSVAGFPSPHSATGTATHLGKYTGEGTAYVLSFDPVTGSGTFEGSFVFVAANGDRLACTYGDTSNGAKKTGQFQVYPAPDGEVYVQFTAEFNPVPSKCTGRFKDVVAGSFLMVAVTEPFEPEFDAEGFTPPFDYTWKGDGWIQFGEGN